MELGISVVRVRHILKFVVLVSSGSSCTSLEGLNYYGMNIRAVENWIMWLAQYYIHTEAECYDIDIDIPVVYVMLTNKMHFSN